MMHAPGATHAIAKLQRFGTLGDEACAPLHAAASEMRAVPPRAMVHAREDIASVPHLVLTGCLRESFVDAEGRMQTVAIRLPGDVVGTDALWTHRHAYDLTALAPSRVMPAPFIDKTLHASPLADRFGLIGLIEESMLKDRLRMIGRARAEERLLHFFLELNARQAFVLEGVGARAWVPFSQTEIANATGLTNVYVSKTLTRLRERGTITIDGDTVTLADRAAIAEEVDFIDHLARATG